MQPPPPQIIERPAPNPSETSRQLFEAQLQFNPQLTAQQVGLQQQFGPQLAQLQTDIQRQQAPQLLQSQLESAQQFTPQFRQLIEQQFPQIPVLSDQVLSGLQNPSALTPEQQALQDVQRERSRQQIRENVRLSSNLGGTLFSGNRQLSENRALGEFEQNILSQDIARQQQERAQRLAELTQLFQLAGFQVQQPTVGVPNVPTFGQPVVPTGDALLNALTQTNLNPIVQGPLVLPGTPGQLGAGALFAQGFGQGLGGSFCHVAEVLYGTHDLRTMFARAYVLHHATWFVQLYGRYSRTWASWLRRMPIFKPLVRPIWDRMWKTAVREAMAICRQGGR